MGEWKGPKRWMPHADGMVEKFEGPYVLWEDYAKVEERAQDYERQSLQNCSIADSETERADAAEHRADELEMELAQIIEAQTNDIRALNSRANQVRELEAEAGGARLLAKEGT